MTDPTQSDGEREVAEGGNQTQVLEVADLGHSFGDVDVFADLSFSVAEGSVTALVGPNGSGKTTLLRAVLGLLAPDEGRVAINRSPDSGRRIGYLPQSPAFRPTFTVEETLQFYADLLDKEVNVSAVLDRVGLSSVPDRRVDALSGGMTRLLGVGQAILGDPGLVVLDEPTGDLDPRMTEYVFDVVADLADDGMAILLATHNLTGAGKADDVLLLDHGDVVMSGSPADFVARTETDDFRGAFLELTGGEEGAVSVGSAKRTEEADAEDAADSTAPSASVRSTGGDDE
ncbi:ABC transporter ATP-binding protein [Halorussus lipolyticus]|uniref:ABC transporter ATP-binding protein n=1 Tax=Halorussus lipolyticus TaxID=3034024 RepID=UPI0023E821FC|nr:ABC transporter ATP-binding protein [Halorussus sp. DT80]